MTQKKRHERTEPKADNEASLKHALAKTETITFRLSAADKESMQAIAKRYRITVSEYIVNLHHYAKDRINPRPRRETTPGTDHES